MSRRKRFYGGLPLSWHFFQYVTDSGGVAMFPQWDFLAGQLGLGGAVNQFLPIKAYVLKPRFITYSDTQYGYRLRLIAPFPNGTMWKNPPVVGWFGLLYKPIIWTPEQQYDL